MDFNSGPTSEPTSCRFLCSKQETTRARILPFFEASGDTPSEIERRVHAAIVRPDTAAETMQKRLKQLGYALYVDPNLHDAYAVGEHRTGKLHMSVCSLREIEAWLEREGIETKGDAALTPAPRRGFLFSRLNPS